MPMKLVEDQMQNYQGTTTKELQWAERDWQQHSRQSVYLSLSQLDREQAERQPAHTSEIHADGST